MSARRLQRPRRDRCPTQCAMMFLNSLAEMFQDKCAEMFLTKFAGTSHRSSVPRFPDRNVILFIKSFPSESAKLFPRKFAMRAMVPVPQGQRSLMSEENFLITVKARK